MTYLSRARAFFEKALALDPNNIEAMVSIAAIELRSLTKVFSVTPNHAMAHLILGYIQIITNRATQGIRECEQALVQAGLALDPTFNQRRLRVSEWSHFRDTSQDGLAFLRARAWPGCLRGKHHDSCWHEPDKPDRSGHVR